MEQKRKRGRPPGDGGADDAVLRRIVGRMLDAPDKKRRSAITAEIGHRCEKDIKRLERKLHARGETLLAEVRAERDRRVARPARRPVDLASLGSLADGVRAATYAARQAATLTTAQAQMRALLDSPAARLAREMQNDPAVRMAREFAQLSSAQFGGILGSRHTLGAIAEAQRATASLYAQLRGRRWY